MTDFRNLQHYLVQLHATPTAEEYYLEGYSLLRECQAEAQSILQTPFAGGSGAATGDPEQERRQLKAYVASSTSPLHPGSSRAEWIGWRRSSDDQSLISESRIITDAAVRRFQCQRAYLRAHAGLRWMNTRNSILRGQKPNASHLGALQQADATLRNVRRTMTSSVSKYS
jgi:hypothetical protein